MKCGGVGGQNGGGGGGAGNSTTQQIHSFEARLGWSGDARMAIVASGCAASQQPHVEVGWVRVAQIGAPEGGSQILSAALLFIDGNLTPC